MQHKIKQKIHSELFFTCFVLFVAWFGVSCSSGADTNLVPQNIVAESNPPEIIAPHAASLVFTQQPQSAHFGGALASSASPVVVEIHDQFGNLFSLADGSIDLALTSGTGQLLLHASDDSLELIDPSIPAVVQQLLSNGPTTSFLSAIWDSPSQQTLLFDQSASLWGFNHQTLNLQQLLPATAPADYIKGLAYDLAGTLYAVLSNCCAVHLPVEALYQYDAALGILNSLGTLTPDQGTIQSFNGLAVDPTTGELYAAVTLSGVAITGTALMRLDPNLLTATLISGMGDQVASLAFANDGTLYAVTDDSATIPSSLFTVNKTSAAMTLRLGLGLDGNGELLASLPVLQPKFATQPIVNGVATFSSLKVGAVGTHYRLLASLPGLPSVESAEFEIFPPVVDGVVAFSSATEAVHENVGTAVVSITLSKAQAHDVTLDIAVGGTATSGIDDNLPTDHDIILTIPAGQTSANLHIAIVDDSLAENDETIDLTIRAAALSSLGTVTQHQVTITANDLALSLSASMDNTLYESATGGLSNGGGTIIFAGRTNQVTGSKRRAVLAFDVAGQVPAGATIVDVQLELTLEGVSGGTIDSLALHRLQAAWGEGTTVATSQGQGAPANLGDVTWLHRFYNTIFWASSGGDFDPTPSASTIVDDQVGTVFTWSSATMVSEVQNWLDDPSSNFGWVLIGNEAVGATNKKFYSRESSVGEPRLWITTSN